MFRNSKAPFARSYNAGGAAPAAGGAATRDLTGIAGQIQEAQFAAATRNAANIEQDGENKTEMQGATMGKASSDALAQVR